MNTIHTTLNELGRATTYQNPSVQAAAQEAIRRSRTRTTRAFNHVGQNIQTRINSRSQG